MLGFLVNVVLLSAIFYNIHQSFKLDSKPAKKYYKHYFIVMAILIAMDNVLSFILYRIPYYQIFKLVFLSWLSVPFSTGPHFVYNVYIKNIHRLFEGDIDSVIKSLKGYVEEAKSKYYEVVNSAKKGGQFEFGSKSSSSKLELPKKQECESSEVEMSNSVVADEEQREETKEDK